MSWDCRQSSLKTLLNTLGMHHKAHTMTIRYGNHDAKDIPAPQDSASLDHVPPEHTMPGQDSDSSNEYNEETDTHCPLAEFLEQFQQPQDQFASLKSATYQPTPMAELIQLIDKLQHLTMTLRPHPTPQPNEEPMQKLCRHTWTPCMPHREKETSPWPCSGIFPHLMDRSPKS